MRPWFPWRETRRAGTLWLLAATLAWLLVASARAATIDYPDFTDTTGLTLNGNAAQAGDVIRLTPASASQAGSAFTDDKVLNPEKSFKTHFRFSMHDSSGSPGDGMAFVLQSNAPTALGDLGGGLGYGGISPSIAVEFDIFDNGDDDPGDNHVALMQNGNAGNHLASETPSFDLYGAPHTAWIIYNASKKALKVYVAKNKSKPANPLFSFKKNLGNALGGKAYAGFTAATAVPTPPRTSSTGI